MAKEKSGYAGLLAEGKDCRLEERQKVECRMQNEEKTAGPEALALPKGQILMKAGEIMREYGVSEWYLKKMRESGILKPRVVMGGVYSVYNREEVETVLGIKVQGSEFTVHS